MIVLAEDDESTSTVIDYALREAGYDVRQVADGTRIWPVLGAADAELLILDLRMPDMNGWEVLRRLQRRTTPSPLPVIAISGQTDRETQAFTRRLGAAAFLGKPIDLDELMATVRRLLAPPPARIPSPHR